MLFATAKDALNWYQSEDRVINKSFLDSVPWKDVTLHEIDKKFLPVLLYMRDIETMTEVYFEELMKSPTGKDPVIREFMERWVTEEPVHGELLNRFMEEAGFNPDADWKAKGFALIPVSYTKRSKLNQLIAMPFGKRFAAVHMTWGAINEYSTLTGYRRLWELADHPVLTYLLKAIAREEARHSLFYWSVARIHLAESRFSQVLSRNIIDRFWTPVGQGIKTEADSNLVIRTLFAGEGGVDTMKKFVNDRVAQLPGFENLTRVTDRITQASMTV
ncbi:hypothetical protein A3C09_02705 [Candidatus Uhrbacteria bacterium RIFCSPHIGHO2_02_FULL_47_44]|uniref:Ferritin-like domain-containing protein n=1 Tax=Candidatus Uhrbacteria bacterium RIFCSPLOWO2_02_FULL_48_18 TaxID=1802408 RepID=A0A1F7V8A0_9BACT|nr:MAG: hypothetical protein A2839_00105 [Candidatus Uhrbacteria bacterium RIFCSPHIGHO2_01_FULL_47_10]OGL70208.1 MAG: hypothetical protein A3C09_02705 [Candidatus Uhrbacteria bacterium RIFCSPHIGHO2_02_FULL_47_44]OGL77116.1 MAG: hypothetical protein A3E97_03450 [Candidatus Uhrbacteria bacterium RIFCSPHIGHO2_12_FULL_47_12]OGL80457.1 MAG: hypothetical protein A3B20_03550 [Candidatus Uhrbacteria bacterium RIFCSPLOWO2_01_FULL_47_17]OGL86317.1 MAG: hypothetical protein A3I41_02030 [Candidatus Uhrbact